MDSEHGGLPPPIMRKKRLFLRLHDLRNTAGAIFRPTYLCVVALLSLVALYGWLMHTEHGARTLLTALAHACGNTLNVQGIHGQLAGPLTLEHIALERPDERVALDQVQFNWKPSALLHASLHITSLQIGRLTLTQKIAQTKAPPRLPDNIALPITLQLDHARINQIAIAWGPIDLIELGTAAFNLDFDGQRYRVQWNPAAATANSGLSGQLTLGAVKPYALHAALASGPAALHFRKQTTQTQGALKLDGNLAEFTADINFAINQTRMQGHAMLRPFSAPTVTDARLVTQALDLSAWRADLPHTAFDGTLSSAIDGTNKLTLINRMAGAYNEQRLPVRELTLAFRQTGPIIAVDRIAAQLGTAAQPAGMLTGQGLYDSGTLTLALSANAIDLHRVHSAVRPTRLSGNIDLHAEQGKQQFTADLHEPWGKKKLAFSARASLTDTQLAIERAALRMGDNRFDIQGELSRSKMQLSFALHAPQLTQLGPSFSGSVQLDGRLHGNLTQPRLVASGRADNLNLPGQLHAQFLQGTADIIIDRNQPWWVHAAQIDANGRGLKSAMGQLALFSTHVQLAPQPTAPLAFNVHVEDLTSPQLHATQLDATAQGTTVQHTVKLQLAQVDPAQNWMLSATGGLHRLDAATHWQGDLQRIDAAGRFVAHLISPAALLIGPQRLQLAPFRLQSTAGDLVVEKFTRDAHGIATRGRVERLQVAQLLKFTHPSPALTTDLQLNGAWEIDTRDALKATIQVHRQSGDIVMQSDPPVALGLHTLELSAGAAGGLFNVRLDADGSQLGHIQATAHSTLSHDRQLAWSHDARITGTAKIDIPSLAWTGPLIAPSAIVQGQLQSAVTLDGTWAQPRLMGQINGSGLRFLDDEYGIDLQHGVLESEFHGDAFVIKRLAFQDGAGHVVGSGTINFSDHKTQARMAIQAEHFAVIHRIDRKLVVSGQSQLAWHDGQAQIRGAFDVDAGLIDIGREDTPQLSDDVIIVAHRKESGKNEKAKTASPALVDLNINLAKGVALKGRGLDGVLVGQIQLNSTPEHPLHAQGTLQITQGTYAAYGRKLAIEQGVLRFNGPLNNPAVDLLAMRRGQEVEAGVAVRGSVTAPRVTLVSEPAVADAEKLSWLVLGRSMESAGSSDLSTLQSAAGALLSEGAALSVQSQIGAAFGLDDVRIATSPDNLQQRIVTLGKRLSSRLYVSYEQSLQTAGSVLLLRYTLSPRLTLEAEAGARSALSLFYNVLSD